MYARKLGEETLEFRHRGWLLDNSFLLYDLQTDSLWCQVTGRAVLGPHKGKELERLPVTHTTWGEWKFLHPETLVLAKPPEKIERYRQDKFQDYYERNQIRFGLSVCLERAQKLYPLDQLEETPVVNDLLGDLPLLVVFHAPSQTAVAYDRRVGESSLSFEHVETSPADVILRDVDTGGTWSGLRGRLLPGGGEGPAALRPVVSSQFAVQHWQRHFPQGSIYRATPESRQ